MTARTATRRASGRYATLAAGAGMLGAPGGVRRPLENLGRLIDVAHELAAGAEPVIWVHETAAAAWGLPARLRPGHAEAVTALTGRACRAVGESGWVVLDAAPVVYLAFPGYSGDFAGLGNAGELLEAVEKFRRAVGFAFMFSGASTIHKLIRQLAKPAEPDPEPGLQPPFQKSAWTVPASTWGLSELDTLAAAGRRWVRCFDRRGSYLSAWTGATLPDGPWLEAGPGMLEPGPESARPAGYWLLEQTPDPGGLFDPFRRYEDQPGPRWVTTPLAQLAVDIAGEAVPYLGAVLAQDRCRALDTTAARLRDARDQLADTPAALRALKDGYSAASNWFENGKRPPDPLARPAWTRTIHDRFVANTYRALAKVTPGPWALTDIDTALFALTDPDETPDGLRCDGLGGWKPKGDPVPIDQAAGALAAGGPHAVMNLAEGR